MIARLKSFINKGHQRTILAKKNILFSFFIKAFQMIIVFTMISVSIKYLGKENYGIWIVLSGIIVWSNIFDLGFSNGLRNRLAEARAEGNSNIEKYYVSTTYAFLLIMALILTILFVPLFFYLDWQTIINTTTVENEIIRYIVLIIFILFILQFILKPIGSILQAYQWPSIVQLINLFGSILALLGIFYLLSLAQPASLSLYTYIVAGTPVLALLLATIYFYKQKFSKLIPSIKYVKQKYFKNIVGLGLSFFIIQLSAVIVFQTDNMIISYLFGPAEVTNYNIVYRYFSIITIVFGVIMAPFWTAFTDAYQKNDFLWIRNTMRTLILLLGGSIIGSIFLLIISNNIYSIWIDKNLIISNSLSALMAIYVVLYSLLNIFSYFSNGTGKVKVQMFVYIFAALINIPMSIFFGKILEFGVDGVLLATIISTLLTSIIMIIQYYKLVNNRAEGIWNA